MKRGKVVAAPPPKVPPPITDYTHLFIIQPEVVPACSWEEVEATFRALTDPDMARLPYPNIDIRWMVGVENHFIKQQDNHEVAELRMVPDNVVKEVSIRDHMPVDMRMGYNQQTMQSYRDFLTPERVALRGIPTTRTPKYASGLRKIDTQSHHVVDCLAGDKEHPEGIEREQAVEARRRQGQETPLYHNAASPPVRRG
jgi:hypothetical protein